MHGAAAKLFMPFAYIPRLALPKKHPIGIDAHTFVSTLTKLVLRLHVDLRAALQNGHTVYTAVL